MSSSLFRVALTLLLTVRREWGKPAGGGGQDVDVFCSDSLGCDNGSGEALSIFLDVPGCCLGDYRCFTYVVGREDVQAALSFVGRRLMEHAW